MRKWKKWESETNSLEYQFANGKKKRRTMSLFLFLHRLNAAPSWGIGMHAWAEWSWWSSCIADPSRFRFTHQTSFVKRHLGLSSTPGVRWIVSSMDHLQLSLFFFLIVFHLINLRSPNIPRCRWRSSGSSSHRWPRWTTWPCGKDSSM